MKNRGTIGGIFLVTINMILIGLYFGVVWFGNDHAADQSEEVYEMVKGDVVEDVHREIEKKMEKKEGVGTFIMPLDRASERVILKPFGIYITAQNSPVSPERFQGYHTGADFEVFEDEKDERVEVRAVCDGVITQKRWVSGYGGVVVELCELEDEVVSVVYGHLFVSSVEKGIEDRLSAGDVIGVLGEGYSNETDGERKHLHLSIYKGSDVDIRGYVDKFEDINMWSDIMEDTDE